MEAGWVGGGGEHKSVSHGRKAKKRKGERSPTSDKIQEVLR